MKDLMTIDSYTHRLTMPYKDIFTTVYTIKLTEGVLLFDAGSYDTDAEEYLLPMLSELAIAPDDVRYVFISHNHKDHSGGLPALLPHLPNAAIISPNPSIREAFADRTVISPADGDTVAEVFRFVSIKGHTADSCAILDTRTNTLITGDCLQLYGIFGSQDWASNISYPSEHLAALEKVRALDADNVITAHDYHPYGFRAIGKEQVSLFIDACREPIMKLRRLILDNPDASDAEIRLMYNSSDKIPTISERIVGCIRKEAELLN